MQFNHILFANDFSDPSRALTGEVEWLANRFRSTVSLLHVMEAPSAWYAGIGLGATAVAPALDLAEQTKQRLNAYPIGVPENRVRRVFSRGDAATEIMSYVERQDVDLVIMGTHGHGVVRSLLGGSVLGKVLHDANCPVLTAAYNDGVCRYKPVISKILCAVELTGEAMPLIRAAAELAHAFTAQVRIIHAVPDAETRPNKYFDFDLHQYLIEAARIELCNLQREAGTNFPVTVSSDSIAKAIADAANECECDLVLIGRGQAQSAVGQFHTHAYDIIRNVPCPVLSCVVAPDHISSSCNGEHLDQYAISGQPQIGCPTL